MANPTTTVTDYCGVLTRSRLLPPHEVSTLAERWRADAKATDADVDAFRKHLVARRLLTEYQAVMVQRGHADGYFVDSYVIQDRIGKGQMAGVYKAIHATGQVVALKVLASSKAKNPHILARFQREARLLTQLNHPNIVRAYQLGSIRGENGSPGVHYIVMEYLEGETVDEVILRRKKLPPAEAARLLTHALNGLQHLHEKRMIHRDLKPANLMLVPTVLSKIDTTLQSTLKILDIGLGRELFDEENSATRDMLLTAEGSLVGTPDYLAPEQARDARVSDVRSDIYSLGCVLYALLAGRPPFVEKNVMATMVKHATEPPPSIVQFNSAVQPGLHSILNRMLAKDPAARYQTPAEAAVALQPYLPSDGIEAMTTTLLPGFEEFLHSQDGSQPLPALSPGGAAGSSPAPSLRVTPDARIAQPVPRSGGEKAKSGLIEASVQTKPRHNPTGPPSEKNKVGTGPSPAGVGPAKVAGPPDPPALKQAVPSPPNAPQPVAVGDFDVELVGTPAPLHHPADIHQALVADLQMRPLYDLDRRDFIMLSLGAGGVLAAVGLGLLVARWQGHKIQPNEEVD